MHMHRADALLANAADCLRAVEGIRRVAIAGDLRRGCELIRDLSLVAEADVRSAAAVPGSGSELKVHFSDRRHFGAALLDATGSPTHLAMLRAFAKSKGYRLDARGIWKSRKLVAAETEEEIYAELGLEFIPPELREGGSEIELAARRRIPDLVSRLRAAQPAVLAAPDDALLRRVLAKLFADRQVTVDPGVIDFLALRMERSLEAAGLLVEHLDRAALAQGAPISKRLAAVVAAEMFDNQPDFWPEGPI